MSEERPKNKDEVIVAVRALLEVVQDHQRIVIDKVGDAFVVELDDRFPA